MILISNILGNVCGLFIKILILVSGQSGNSKSSKAGLDYAADVIHDIDKTKIIMLIMLIIVPTQNIYFNSRFPVQIEYRGFQGCKATLWRKQITLQLSDANESFFV